MATTVAQTYTPSQNVSITKRNGVITLVTTWTSGAPATSTVRVTNG